MKKLSTIILIACTVLAALAFTACGDPITGKDGNVKTTENSVAFTASQEVMNLTDSTSLKDYMDVLKNNGELTFEGSNGDYGFFISSVNGKAASGNSFWGVYTDLVTIEGDDFVYSNAAWGTVEIDGKTLNSASVGVSSLPCIDGYTYALVLSTY